MMIDLYLWIEKHAIQLSCSACDYKTSSVANEEGEAAQSLLLVDRQPQRHLQRCWCPCRSSPLVSFLQKCSVYIALLILYGSYIAIHIHFDTVMITNNYGEGASSSSMISKKLPLIFNAMCFPLLLCYFIGAPLRQALGYVNIDTPVSVCEERRYVLRNVDGQSRNIAMYGLVATVLGTMGDTVLLYEARERDMSVIPLYALSAFCNLGMVYFALSSIAIMGRILHLRLSKLEEQVQAQIHARRDSHGSLRPTPLISSQKPNYAALLSTEESVEEGGTTRSARVDEDRLVESVIETYCGLRHDLHHVAETQVGLILLLLLTVFTLETASVMIVLNNEIRETSSSMTLNAAMIACYLLNASMLILAFESLGQLPTQCIQYIGPKLGILAVDGNRKFLSLSNLFLHAPIRLHVGNFEATPEYANGMAIFLFGVLMVVFGLKIPE